MTNSGQAAAGSFNVKVGEAQQSVNSLAIGETKLLFFAGYTNPVTVAVDPGNAVAESNEQNNSRSENLPVPTAPLPCTTNPTSTFTPVPSVPTQTPTPTPAASVFQNTKYNFKFTLPTGAAVANQTDNAGRVNLQFTTGTNLSEKYIQVYVVENANPCVSPAVEAFPLLLKTLRSTIFSSSRGQGRRAPRVIFMIGLHIQPSGIIPVSALLSSCTRSTRETSRLPRRYLTRTLNSAVFTQIINTFNWITP